MDMLTIILIGFAIVLFISICGWCRRKTRTLDTFTTVTIPGQVVPAQNAPYPTQATIISTTQAVPGGYSQAPYPTMPMPQPYPQAQNSQYPYPPTQGPYPPTQAPYPPQPYPTQGLSQGINYPNYCPYPPNTMAAATQQNPPTYDEATGVYAKQSAYNPNFN